MFLIFMACTHVAMIPDPPVAHAGRDQVADVRDLVFLDGSLSEGDDLTYSWCLPATMRTGIIEQEDAAETSFTAVSIGLYPVTLMVCDRWRRCDTDRVSIRIINFA